MIQMDLFDKLKVWVLFMCLINQLGHGFYLPGSYPYIYDIGDFLSVKVNSLTSIDTEIPFSYYSLPFCLPREGVKDSTKNLGQLLMGDRIQNSPYRFKMYTNETEIFLCQTKPLSGEEFKVLKKRIDEMYQVNLILDNLPAIRYTRKEGFFLRWTGYPVGIKVQDVYYLFNHLKFNVLVHKYEDTNAARVMGTGDGAEVIPMVGKSGSEKPGYMVVGFEVVPCSIQHTAESLKNLKMYNTYPSAIKCDPTTVAMAIKENEPLAFTYEFSFVESDINYPHKYGIGDVLSVKVNSLTSIDTEIPFSYYSLPFCQPQEGVKDSAENLGELLMGDRIENSPYRFKMYTNETEIFLCQTKPLSGEEFKVLKKRIDEMYQVNLILDNLPAIRYTRKEGFFLRWTGYPVGIKVQDVYYLFNHLKFNVLVHKYEDTNAARVMGTGDGAEVIPMVGKSGSEKPGYMVVGFEVVPCSIQHTAESLKNLKMYNTYPSAIKCDPTTVAMAIKENEPLAFTYEFSFVESDIKWPSRWDAYLKMEGVKVHWFSILNSLMVTTFLAGIIVVIFLRTVRYEELNKEAQAQMNEELSGWKLVVGDVFHPPNNPSLFCVMVGDGVQILGMAVVTTLFAALGFSSPASRGTLVTGMLFFYLILGIAAGYVAVRLWKTISCGDHKGWVSVSLWVACFFPGIGFLILMTLNFLLWNSHSTRAIPFSLFVILILLWFFISVPLTLIGGCLGARAPHIQYPVRTNHVPREIPAQRYPSWLLLLGAGILPFGTLFVEIFFIMSSIWSGRVYYAFGFLFIVLTFLVVVCAEVSIVLTYRHLYMENWNWWWKSFFASGSVAIYVFLYSIKYLVFDLKSLSGPVSATLYLVYSLFIVLAIMLATGTVGFLSSFWFVHYLFSSVKLD
ncbi:unnamed protein product [Ilex paraguariensis]|uniref:Transmembrane 9 superfamily member n=1 Tax=Ilex paraguariensis TaxID=185542 RepID=A0ABC8U6U5_9AQUA